MPLVGGAVALFILFIPVYVLVQVSKLIAFRLTKDANNVPVSVASAFAILMAIVALLTVVDSFKIFNVAVLLHGWPTIPEWGILYCLGVLALTVIGGIACGIWAGIVGLTNYVNNATRGAQ